MSLSELNFDDDLAQIPVTIKGKRYILKEADAGQVRLYRNFIGKRPKFEDGQLSAVGDVADSEAYLISLCLSEVGPDGTLTSMKNREPTIHGFSNKAAKGMFEWLEVNSGLQREMTADQLRVEITKLKKKLAKLEPELESDPDATSGPEGDAKNGHSATTNTISPRTASV